MLETVKSYQRRGRADTLAKVAMLALTAKGTLSQSFIGDSSGQTVRHSLIVINTNIYIFIRESHGKVKNECESNVNALVDS